MVFEKEVLEWWAYVTANEKLITGDFNILLSVTDKPSRQKRINKETLE